MRGNRMRNVAVAGLLVVSACGGGDGSTTTADRSTTSSSARPTTTITTTSTSSTTASTSTTSTVVTTTPPSSTSATSAPATTAPATTTPPPPPPTTTVATTTPPLPAGDNRVFVLGDSVLLGGQETVPAALTGWVVTYDAVGSRRLPQGIEVLRARRSEIGRVVVIQQGNNYIAGEGSFAAQIDQAMAVLAGVDRVVWLTVAEKWPSRVEINAAIRAAPQRWPQAVVADWAAMVAAHPEYASDMLHLTTSGRLAIARLIADHVGPP